MLPSFHISLRLDKKIDLSFLFGLIIYSSSVIITPFISKVFLYMGISVNQTLISLMLLIISVMVSGFSNVKLFVYYIFYAFYNVTWVPISIQGIIKRKNKEWNPTKHIRNIKIYDIE